MGKSNFRLWVAGIWTFVTNCYLTGFAEGRIYSGPLKNICFPGLNCYSCPGALFSCPIGALQAVVGSWKYKVSLYMGGFFMILGAVLGRFTCGWLCPFGLVQDLLYKIPFLRKINRFRADGILRWFKYVVLAVFVILTPMFVVDFTGQGAPAFCKYICPSGTLMGGVPLVSVSKPLQEMIGALFEWKVAILAATVVAAIIIYRPFCKYVCPLGAIYGVFNRASLYRLTVDESKCIHCGKCAQVCKMRVDPTKNPGSCECIRCGDCRRACPVGAISMGFGKRRGSQAKQGLTGDAEKT